MLATFFKTFWTIFIAELGDKTQLACLAFGSVSPRDKWVIFAASSVALACSSAIAVFLGCQTRASFRRGRSRSWRAWSSSSSD